MPNWRARGAAAAGPRTAVTRACFYDPDLNELYEAFAQQWGFIPLPSRPSHPQEQGVQERSGGYVNDNALKGHRFESLGEINDHLRGWNRRIAQQRIHAKRQQPGSWVTNSADRPAHKPARQEAYQANLLARAEHIGENAAAWARAAIVERDVRSYRLLQGMLALTRSNPRQCVDRACAVALVSRSFRHKTLKRLVELEVARIPPASRRLTQEHALIRPLSDYAVLTGGQR